MWVVLGRSGLKEYRNQRQQEIIGKKTRQDGCCFHDGEKVLQTVEDMHDRLLKKDEVRPGDHITKPVLHDMVPSMLEEDPEGRQNAHWLWKKSQKLLKDTRSKLEEADPPQTPKKWDAAAKQAKFFPQNPPDTPPYTMHSAGQPYDRNSHSYGPPPNYPQYSSNLQMSGWSSSNQEVPKRRSGTWSEHNTGTDMTLVSLNESLTPPPTARQAPRASSPPDKYKESQQRTNTIAFTPDETATRPGGELWRNESSRYSLPNVRKDVNTFRNEPLPLPFRSRADSPLPETDPAAEVHPSQQARSNMNFRSNGTFGPPLVSPTQHLETENALAGREQNYPKTDVTSKELGLKSPPKTPYTSPPATATAAAQPTPKIKLETPYLSYKEAKQVREKRHALPPSRQNLLNDLKGRDHVRSQSLRNPFITNAMSAGIFDGRFAIHERALGRRDRFVLCLRLFCEEA